MKKTSSTAVLLLLTASLAAACGSDSGGKTAASSSPSAKASTAPSGSPAASAAPQSDKTVTIRISLVESEISKDDIAAFEAANPTIKIVREDVTATKLAAQIATGEAPDIIRVNGVQELPSFVIKGVALDLSPYFQKSALLKADDMLPVADVYRFDGKNVGKGPIYGFPKDWSPDFSIWYNKKLFAAAGVPEPDAKTPMTWNQLFDLAKKMTIKSGDNVTQYGLVKPNLLEADLSSIMGYTLSKGVKLSTDDYGQIDFTKPAAKEALKLWGDAVKGNYGPNSVNNFDKGVADVDLFLNGKAAMIQRGYWFSSRIRTNDNTKMHLDDYVMIPAPVAEGGQRVSPTGSATGAIINKASKHPEEAWKVFEWYFGGKPAEDRAKTGNGVPALKHLMASMPQATNFDKQTYAALQEELKYGDKYLEINPFLLNAGTILSKHLNPYYFDKSSLDEAAANITKDSNIIIAEAKNAAASGK
ncbi:MAG: sugar ABC transporter substrate-binding protein [Paenibacillaceae bacterium]|nr:sugar ABC transporter substrate-binding protein [Paenibacillaceae bacterium]